MSDTEEKLQAMPMNPARIKGVPGGSFGGYEFLECIPSVVCADGLKMSIQTSKTHYCAPRENRGPWYKVEIGFPSRRVEDLMPFIDGPESDPTGTVYAYVPIEIVVAVIDAHGGLAS